MKWNLEATYLTLPEIFASPVRPQRFPEAKLRVFNLELSQSLGLGKTPGSEDEKLFFGQVEGNEFRTFSQAYAGHQFGHFNLLGDGRAAVLGEILDPQGQRWDLQYKGCGPTPFSRRGDGKAALGPLLREYLVGESLHALGIPTTRVLSVSTTGEKILRETELPGALLIRAGHSHIRVGTFQFAAVKGGPAAVKALADYTIDRHYPLCRKSPEPYIALFREAARNQASLVARWMGVGFIHGVMNTDNMALSGQSLDFGPCGFMDEWDPSTLFSSIDVQGRYAYSNQPVIAQWNLARWAETLIPLFSPHPDRGLEIAQEEVNILPALFQNELDKIWAAKLGLDPREAGSQEIWEGLLREMEENKRDFTLTFRGLTDLALGEDLPDSWLRAWEGTRNHTPQALETMNRMNPLYIPRNHWMEEALEEAQKENWGPFHNLEAALRSPFSPLPGLEYLAGPGPRRSRPYVTYCGT